MRLLLAFLVLSLARLAAAFPCGDVNGDGVVNIADALIIAQYDVGVRTCAIPGATFTHPELCDIANDNACNIGDTLKAAQCDVGLISCAFTCGFNVCATTTTTTVTTTTTTGTGATTTTTTITTTTTTTTTTSTTSTTTLTTTTTSGVPTTTTTTPGSPGAVHWVTRYGGPNGEFGAAVTTDTAGNIITGGSYQSGADLGTGTLPFSGLDDGFVAKYTSAGTAVWVRPYGSAGLERTQSVATDPAGNVYATGWFEHTVDFGCLGPVTSAGLKDIFVVKYSSANACQWVKRYGTTNNSGQSDDIGNGIAITTNDTACPPDNVCVVVNGTPGGDINLGGGTLVPFSTGRSSFAAKYKASDGSWVWAKLLGSGGESFGNGVAVDTSGNVFANGSEIGDVIFNGNQVPSPGGGTNIFLAKYGSASGTETWLKLLGGSGGDTGQGVAIGTDGNPVLVGQFNGTVNFGGGNRTALILDTIVAKYNNAAGAYIWDRQGIGPGAQSITVAGSGIAIDRTTNEPVVTGQFNRTVDFGSGILTTYGQYDVFLVKLAAATGVQVWGKRYGSPTGDGGVAVAIDTNRNVFATGYFSGTATFDTTTRTSAGSTDIFLVNVYP